jgi:hypothetical protein
MAKPPQKPDEHAQKWTAGRSTGMGAFPGGEVDLEPARDSIFESIENAVTGFFFEAGRAAGFVDEKSRLVELVAAGVKAGLAGQGVGQANHGTQVEAGNDRQVRASSMAAATAGERPQARASLAPTLVWQRSRHVMSMSSLMILRPLAWVMTFSMSKSSAAATGLPTSWNSPLR